MDVIYVISVTQFRRDQASLIDMQSSDPASTRRGTGVVVMLVGHVEITWGTMWKCLDMIHYRSLQCELLTYPHISTYFPT